MSQIRPGHEPIAIIGIGCRFPQAAGPEAFWRLVRDGVDAIVEIPRDRFDAEALYSSAPGTPGRISTRWGGFLDGLDLFDAPFFGISPREADRLDPQQRLLLEVGWEALEDAGQVRERLAGSRTGVFVGLWLNDYEARLFRDPDAIDFYMTTGSGRYSASGRLSYAFGFEGPSLTVDTACSSSLVAVHLACQSLRLGESTVALAGGANAILEPAITLAYSQSNMMAPDGRCKFGDARANGYVRSEGAGIVVLKRLSDAIADGDHIYAVIRGSAVNNDGRSSGFLATPAQHGQEQLLRHAYRDAGVSPGRVQYVEAHGTGTNAGDPVELGALGAVLAEDRPADQPCRIGSVKTNIGHTEGAAGVAGLIKTTLALQAGVIPANLHFETPNPNIPWSELPLVVSAETRAWSPADGAPVAGVSAFGIAGTNAHVVLQGWSAERAASTSDAAGSANLLTLSAAAPEALRDLVAAYRDRFSGGFSDPMADVCYSAAVRRTHHEHRLACVVRDPADAVEQLDAFLRGEPRARLSQGQRAAAASGKVAFVFPGQGSQWIGMGRRLLAEQPIVAQILGDCDAAIREFTDWSLLAELTAGEAESRLDRIDVIQPSIFAMQVALAGLWRSWGIEPGAVVGHSMGEVAAAYVSGALSLRDAARVICRRSRLLRRTSGKGAMAVVELTLEQASAALAGYGDRLSVAVSNSPRSTVLSGDPAALDEVIARLETQEVFCRRVKVDVASHSPQMDVLRGDLLDALSELQPRSPLLPFYSTVTGLPANGGAFDPAYWVRNLREPVLFLTTVQRLIGDGFTTFIEMSPHPLLVPAVQEILQHAKQSGVAVGSLRRGEDEQAEMLGALGALYAFGRDGDWNRLYPSGGRLLPLPSYPWQRERYWYEDSPASRRRRVSARRGEHPLIGRAIASAVQPGTYFWSADISADLRPGAERDSEPRQPFESTAALLEAVIAGVREVGGARAPILEEVQIGRPLNLTGDASRSVQMVMSPAAPGRMAFQFLSRHAGVSGDETPWTRHLAGNVDVGGGAQDPDAETSIDVGAVRSRCREAGEHARSIEQLWMSDGEALARLTSAARPGAGESALLPLLQACLSLLAAVPRTDQGEARRARPLTPVDIAQVRVHRVPDSATALWFYAARTDASDSTSVSGDALVADDDGLVAIELRGIRLQEDLDAAVRDSLFGFEWARQCSAGAATARPNVANGGWLIVCDRGGVAERLAAQLEGSGERIIRVVPGDSFERVGPEEYRVDTTRRDDFAQLLCELSGAGQPVRGIVHLSALDLLSRDLAAAIADGRVESCCAAALRLVQALAIAGLSSAPRLFLVTGGVHAIGDASPISIAQSPLWGLGSAIAGEHPELACTRVDLSASASDVDIAMLAKELLSTGSESQVSLRGSERFVARLARWCPDPDEPLRIEPDSGTYLITGGLGSLGLSIARWMVDHGARHLVLMGRRPPSSDAVRIIETLQERGAAVFVAAADVSQEAQLAAALDQIGASMPPLRGVVHAAAVLDDGILLEQDVRRLQVVMQPKVRGTWNLHRLTQTKPLDWFLMFSSVSSFLASAGTGNYGAANAFLDAFAQYRRSLGLPATTINWGGWAQMGLAAGQGERMDRLAERGLRSFKEQEALAALGSILRSRPTHVAAMDFDAKTWCDAADVTGSRAFFERLTSGPSAAASDGSQESVRSLVEILQEVEPGPNRRLALETYLQEQVAKVLRLAPGRIDPQKPFRTMGLDSLMALELRNRLEARTGIAIPATLVWNYPTVAQLAEQLAIRIGVTLDADADPAPGSRHSEPEGQGGGDAELAALVAEVEALSAEEARRLLAE
jgi:myxalamid-type polyketide synthase MxaE and MxaD